MDEVGRALKGSEQRPPSPSGLIRPRLTSRLLDPASYRVAQVIAPADGKVLFQNQEIAFVVAIDRYVAADAADLVEVEYEELPVVVDPFF